MTISTIAGYQFIALDDLTTLQAALLKQCQQLKLLGTILLSSEGININIAGTAENIQLFVSFLKQDSRFSNISFNEAKADLQPYQLMLVKIKKEIITMRSSVNPEKKAAPAITPQEFKQWLDEKRDITVLDTRNNYEVKFGTFQNALNSNIENFSEFTKVAENLNREKPIVMFCTGGIRCEKAALYLIEQGFSQVFQLQKGILNYFKEVGGAYYEGECFVFDQRIAVNSKLEVSGTQQCKQCQGPIKQGLTHTCET